MKLDGRFVDLESRSSHKFVSLMIELQLEVTSCVMKHLIKLGGFSETDVKVLISNYTNSVFDELVETDDVDTFKRGMISALEADLGYRSYDDFSGIYEEKQK